MNNAEHLSEDDLALFALQLLSETELDPVVAHLELCEECRVKVAEVQGDLVGYATTAEMHTPPAAARERLLLQLEREKKIFPMERPLPQPEAGVEPMLASRGNSTLFADIIEEPSRSGGAGFFAWAGWAVAAGVAVFSFVQFRQHQQMQQTIASLSAKVHSLPSESESAHALEAMKTLTDGGALQVTLKLPPDEGEKPPANPEGHVAYVAERGSLVFIADHLKPLPPYKTYELWVLPSNGHDPIAAGVFKPDANGNSNVIMPELPKGVPASGFGVTIEDEGGSATPTKPVVLVGTT